MKITVGQKVEKSPNKELTSSTNCFITKLSKHHGDPKYTLEYFLSLLLQRNPFLNLKNTFPQGLFLEKTRLMKITH